MKKTKIYGYMCTTDWRYETTMKSGFPEIYKSVKDLKKNRICYVECGITKVEVVFVKCVLKENFHDNKD